MIVKVADLSIVPPGGWRYRETETGFEFKAATLGSLVDLVAAHRASNKLQPGNPRAEIQAYVCAQLPVGSEDCVGELEAGDEVADIALKTEFTMDDVKRFLVAAKEALGRKGLVKQEEADRRAGICASCPLNQSVGGCWTCRGLAEWIFRLIGTRVTAHASRLRQCGSCGCNIKAKVWLPLDVARKVSEGYKFPSWCWIKNDPAQ
jgi:hypothetical protein